MANTPQKNAAYDIVRGTDPILRYPVTGAPETDPASGWATLWTFRKTVKTPDPELLQIAGEWNDEEETIDVPLSRAQTLALATGKYVASLFRTDDGSNDLLALDEKITVIDNVKDEH